MKKECLNCAYSFYSDFYLECSLYPRINNNNACKNWLNKNNAPYCGCDNSKGDCDEWEKKN